MRSVEIQAKTVEEAISTALEQLNATEEEVKVEVIERESAGFFGIGGKDATVRVTLLDEDVEEVDAHTLDEIEEVVDTVAFIDGDDDSEDETDEDDSDVDADDDMEFEDRIQLAADSIEEFLHKLLQHFDLEDMNEVSVRIEENRIVGEINGDDCGILIGRKGETLRSIQYIASLVANKTAKTRVRFVLDIGGYKAKRKNNVASLATRTADRAIKTGQAFELTPMSAADRRIVHETLNEYDGIITYSEGEEPRRYVVVDLDFDEFEAEEEELVETE